MCQCSLQIGIYGIHLAESYLQGKNSLAVLLFSIGVVTVPNNGRGHLVRSYLPMERRLSLKLGNARPILAH